MGGKSKQETTTQQSSTTAPWQPTQGILQGILGGIQGQLGNYQPTGAEATALNTIQTNAQNAPNFAPQATQLASDLMSGGPDRGGILGDAYAQFQGAMSPYLSADYLDPTKTPGIAAALETVRNDAANNINSMFAGAGRDLSGMHAQALGRGITQAEAPLLLNQYNQNVAAQQGAASGLLSGAGATATGLSGLDQQQFANRAQGLNVGINGVPDAANANAYGILGAANLARNLPLQNLGMLANLTIPIAELGSQSQGTGTTTGTHKMSGAQQFATIAGGLGNVGKFLWG